MTTLSGGMALTTMTWAPTAAPPAFVAVTVTARVAGVSQVKVTVSLRPPVWVT